MLQIKILKSATILIQNQCFIKNASMPKNDI
jgi:hypothetical protein